MKITTIQNTYIEAEIVLPDRIVKNKEDVQLRCVLDSKLGPVYLTEKLTVDEDKSTLNDTYCRWEYDLEDKYILPGTYSFEIVIVQSSGRVIPISHKAENCLVIVPAERGECFQPPLNQQLKTLVKYALPFFKEIPIEANSDINNIIDCGYYTCTASSVVATLKNCPMTTAFRMYVHDVAPGVPGYIGQTMFQLDGTRICRYTFDSGKSWNNYVDTFDSSGIIPTANGGIGLNASVDIGEAEHLECVNRFVHEMNRVAANIGMSKSTFKTPSGYCGNPVNTSKVSVDIEYNSYTTASDMMCLLAAARHSPAVLEIMGTRSYKFRRNNEKLTQGHNILSNSTWNEWAKSNEYVILAAKGGSLSGSVGEIGTDGILNYAILIKDKNNRIFGVTVIGLKNKKDETVDEYSTARDIIKGLIDKFYGASDNAAITEAKIREDYSVGMMVVDFTTSKNFEEDIKRINNTIKGYRFYYNKDSVRVAASLAKILNAIVAVSFFENHYCSINYDDIVGGSGITLAKGDVLTTYDALNVMMLASCNTCATMIARDIGKRLPERS